MLEEAGQVFSAFEVSPYTFMDAGALNLYGNRGAVPEGASMDLGERSCRYGPVIYPGKSLTRVSGQVVAKYVACLSPGKRWDAIQQMHQFVAVRLRDEVRSEGKELANFDKSRPHLFKESPKSRRTSD